VLSSQDTVMVDAEAVRGDSQQVRGAAARRPRPTKKVWHFRYAVATQTLTEIPDYRAPDNHPSWASVSPDGQTVIYALRHDLYRMSRADYQRVLDARRAKTGAAADSADWKIAIEGTRLTTDGVEHYSWAGSEFGLTDIETERSKDRRKRATISWSRDSKRFTAERDDRRKVSDLWVIASVGNKRPTLETYKYDMPGDTNVTQPEAGVYDLAASRMMMQKGFKDQHSVVQRAAVVSDLNEPQRQLWLAENFDKIYLWRRSRDQHKVDVLVADAATGTVRVLIEERLNTYVEHQRLELLKSGDLLW
jgi:hypothetical protein